VASEVCGGIIIGGFTRFLAVQQQQQQQQQALGGGAKLFLTKTLQKQKGTKKQSQPPLASKG
jgi:hypothetical protein